MTDKFLKKPGLMDVAKYVYSIPWFLRKLLVRPSYFEFKDREYAYLSHPYNGTWMNERAVEIPLIWEEVAKHPPEDVLEVGNVLSHYFRVEHLVVDKYERRSGVISKDILDVDLRRRFDCIVSVSTLEHVGWDEVPRVPGKHLQAIEKMRQLLTPDGRIFATIPLGYNPTIDADLFAGRLRCDQISFFKRLGSAVWRESSMEEVRESTYGKRFRTTDGLTWCVWRA
jgi:SAM-dependent methyltransferase